MGRERRGARTGTRKREPGQHATTINRTEKDIRFDNKNRCIWIHKNFTKLVITKQTKSSKCTFSHRTPLCCHRLLATPDINALAKQRSYAHSNERSNKACVDAGKIVIRHFARKAGGGGKEGGAREEGSKPERRKLGREGGGREGPGDRNKHLKQEEFSKMVDH